ncbi:MAG: transglycosylase domain-containing protein, partial [Lactobacillus sp.]|nr:transglycosylase domain-containing protein [Lactobacillus sp.]
MKNSDSAFKTAMSKAWQAIKWFFRRFQVIRWVIFLGLLATLLLSTWFTYKAKTANVQEIKSTMLTKTTYYDNKNQVAGTFYGQKGTYVDLDHISVNVQNAVIATEDRSFYSNWGFDI